MWTRSRIAPKRRERHLRVEKALPFKRHAAAATVLGAAALMWACASMAAPAASAGSPAAATSPPNVAPAAAAPAATGAGPAPVDMAAAKKTFETVCSGCHEAALATDLRNTRRGWEQVVDRMFGFGMSATDAQVNEIVTYLSTNYAPQ